MEPDDAFTEDPEHRDTVIETSVTINGVDLIFSCFRGSLEMTGSVLTGKTYPAARFLEGVRTIFDVGANVGAASLYFHSNYPDATIYSFEPFSKSFELLSKNTATLPNIQVFNYGLMDVAQEAQLNIGAFSFGTNSIGDCIHNTTDSETIRLEEALATARSLGVTAIDILKIDTEGCELPILTNLIGELPPRAIYLEYHSDDDRRRIDALLSPDYMLYYGNIPTPHRGDLFYLRHDAIPENDRSASWGINCRE